LLFKRYNDVSFLLASMSVSDFLDFLVVMFEEMQEEKIWYMWNHLAFREEGYAEFRKKVLQAAQPAEVKKQNAELEALQGLEIANQILGWGGEFDGIV